MTHDAKFSHPALSKPLGPVLRLAGFIVGADSSVLEQTPAGERVQVKWAALSVLLVFVFTTGAWGVGLSVARGWTIENLAVGALIGAVVTLVDRAMIPFHWVAQGQRLAQDHGLITTTVRTSGSKALRTLSVLVRIAAAGVLSFVCAGFLDLALYQRDIQSVIEAQHRADNSGLLQQAEVRVDGEIRRIEDEIKAIATARQAISQRLEAAQDQRSQLVDVKFESAVADRASLTEKREALTKEIKAAKQDAHAEEFGGTRSDGTFVSVAARGPKFAEAIARDEDLMAQMNVIEAQINALDESIGGTTSIIERVGVDPAFTAQIAVLDARHIVLGDELALLKANRTAAVAEAVQMDPAYVPRPEGLIASAAALETLAAQSTWLKSRILAVIVALVLLDLAALGILLMTPAPPVYAARLACRQQNEIGRLVTEAWAEEVQYAAQRAKAMSSIEEVEAELKQMSRRSAHRAWLDKMIAESFAKKHAEPHEMEAAA
jgi:archaellum component FlaC